MAPLALAIALELYLLVRVVSESNTAAVIVGTAIFGILVVAWLLVPALLRRPLPK